MNFGIIGAGKMGFSLGKYLKENNINLVGYYSKSEHSSKEASTFTNTKQYVKLENLVQDSDVILITTQDSQIKTVWENLISFPINNKIICHLSGAKSSEIFSNINQYGAYGYSIHPILAISDKYNSYKNISKAFITIEGDKKYINYLKNIFLSIGNKVLLINKENKSLYHEACVSASNLIIPIIDQSIKHLEKCGFEKNIAIEALYPLIEFNIKNIKEKGVLNSLTGPIERCDLETIKDHYDVLDDEDKELYTILSRHLLKITKIKNCEKDYSKIEKYLGEQYEKYSCNF
ncbi:hypothetical protein KD33_00565 [Clostridium sp. NCR]|uniref:DUF2520 domain-containing protein n=1 Tax=Paraclostridium bifermentans TaxID=1490 RepID=A0A5P3XJX6_PARBF|nr:Rossmann-like and DUF2520 domain-containing protein [Paraclostridium bifermentans]KGJ50534.1 hypothetical protein KD33_00565 [Clostridium sp. NCR]QEZ70667.1 DUF2520 domain-containing protein [Paraclostridium bifermentans]TQO58390.1 DUF2520 domain-containing protein [Paraclostridium bifermentans]